MTAALERLEAFEGTDRDVGVIEERLLKVADGNRCYLPIEEIRLVDSLLRAFPDDVAAHLDGSCGLRHGLPVPKIVGFDDTTARFVLDSAQARKQPDWTYA
jgi:NADH-quinone oxidoreductase subunit F